MNSEIVAGLIGGAVALAAGLAAQAFGAWLSKRRRVRELSGRFLAVLKSVGYIADRAHLEHPRGRDDAALLALQVQTDAISVGAELQMIGPRVLRAPVKVAINGVIVVMSEHNKADPTRWSLVRSMFDDAVRDYNKAMAKIF